MGTQQALLCFSLLLPTHTLEVAVVDDQGTFESSDGSHSGPEEEEAICFAGGRLSVLPAGFCLPCRAVKVPGLHCDNVHENTDHQIEW